MDPFIALYPVFFATAFQWCSFKGADGFNSSCIFCTNNLRQCTTGFAEYLYSKDSEALRRGIFYGKVLLSFIWELQYVSCSVRDFISQVHGQDFSLYVLHLYSSMKNAFFPERKRQKKKRFSGFTPESLFFVLPTYYATGSSAVVSGALSSTADSIVMRSPSASSCGTPAFFRFSVRTVQSAFVRYSVIAS